MIEPMAPENGADRTDDGAAPSSAPGQPPPDEAVGEPSFRPVDLTAAELAELDRALDRALVGGASGDLPVIGAGEIAVAVAWPPDEPRAAAKGAMCPPDGVADFSALVERYRSELEDAGVGTVPTRIQTAPSGRAFLVQPLLPAGAVAERYVIDHPDRVRTVLEQVVDHVVAAVGPTLGIDPQLANWAVDGERLLLLDVGTPMVREPKGDGKKSRDLIDLEPYYASVPLPARPVARLVGPEFLASYHDRRGALTDLGFNLIKAGLEDHCATVVELTAPHLDEPLTVDEIHRAYRQDALIWQVLQASRRADRWWRRHVLRRTYPYLLPPPIDRRLGRSRRGRS